jgi:ATP-binding cassette, subfamily B, bacterial
MSPAARALRPFVLRRRRALAEAGGATVALTAADLAKPWPLALVVDRLLDGRTAPFAVDAGDVRLLAAVSALVLAIALVEAGAQYVADLRLQIAGERIAHELRTTVYDHLQRLSLGFHQQRQKGDLLTRVTSDANAMGDLFAQSLGQITQAALLSAGMLAVLLWLDPLLALVAVATTPLLAVVSWVFRRRVRARARERRTHEGRIASVAGEALAAMTIVKAFGSETHESERVRRGSEERMAAGVEVARLQARFDGLVGAVRAVGTAAVLVAGALRVAAGALSPGELIVFVSYTRKAHNPLRRMARETTKVSAAMARMERLAEILGADDVLADRPGAYHGGRAQGDVALERVSFSYAPGRPALRDVTLRVAAGRCVALMGPSGVGKSTLGALVARLYDPTRGRVLLDGRDLRDCRLAWLREQVAIVLQETVLFSGSVRDNIAYGTDASAATVETAARAAAAHEFIAALPDGYDTQLGPQGAGLSGGQRQRIGIARTLLRDPPVLLLDEPTTGLDDASESELLDGLRALIAGRTTILITHSPRLARLADRVVTLASGRTALADPALPRLAELLDPDAMRPVLERTLRAGTELGDVAVGRVVYKPGELVAVHYRTAPGDAVLTSIAGTDLAARARAPRYAAAARRVDGRSPAPMPLRYDAGTDALVTWLPYDPRLPALAEPPDELARRLRAAGAQVPPDEPALIGYKPRGRAVLVAGEYVLKAYGSERAYAAALTGLRASCAAAHQRVPAVGGHTAAGPAIEARRCDGRSAPVRLRVPEFVAALPELRLTVQKRVAGAPPRDALAAAAEAGALAAAIQRAALADLPAAAPERLLGAARRKAAVIAAVLPELRPRLDPLLERLRAALPSGLPLVPAHGDFHADQLLHGPEGPTVVDFDELCRAAPALDLATYAADVVRGRDGDRAELEAVLDRLLAGYGARPAALDWHVAAAVLGRAAHPFQRQVPDWPDRTERMLDVAEASL